MHYLQGMHFVLLPILILFVPNINSLLYSLIGDIISLLIELSRFQNIIMPSYYEPKKVTKYDFIIVGSGPSGSVLANRLTENKNISVLLLENGDEPNYFTDAPFAVGAFEFTSFNYGYRTEPQEGFCRGCEDGRVRWPHGNVLGGSSVINYMIFTRGSPHDFDTWASLGNPGWSYEEMLPYFKKMEDVNVALKDADYRNEGGYLSVSDVPYRSEIANLFVKACEEAGFKYVDYNGRNQSGVSFIQGTLRNGLRCSAEKAYLQPAQYRNNLKIKLNSKVTKILINSDTKTAYGVEYIYNETRHYVYAEKEVILSAGGLNSPQVLMLSGIGPKDHLNELGIPVIQNLPVGKKLYDHNNFPGIMFEVNQSVVINASDAALNFDNYVGLLSGSGVFTSTGVEAIAFMTTNASTDPSPDYPDMELLMFGGALSSDFGIVTRKIFNVSPKIYDKLFKPLEGKYVYQVTPLLLHPKSYGYIKLNISDPEGAPLFYANYLSDPEDQDIKAFLASIRELQKINRMPSLQKVGAKLVDIPMPGCEDKQFDSDEYWICALRTLSGTYYHQVATCKMGPKSDPESVVDHQLKVHGIKKLRVVDVSIIPVATSGHTVAPAYAVGEKAADIIKNYWKI